MLNRRTLLKFLNKSSFFYNKNIRMSTNAFIPKKENETFHDTLPSVIETLTTSTKFSELSEVAKWIKVVLDYNLTGGKKVRGLTAVMAYEMLEKPENINEDSLRLACVMGWCIEMLHAYFIMVDDIMDGSATRRGIPCWYRKPEIGLSGINDSILVHASLLQILKKYFGNKPQYINIVNLFNEILLFTSIGQHLDYSTGQRKKIDYSLFTTERYHTIIKYKTAYYTFKFPVSSGLLLANITNPEIHKKADDITLNIGQLFQIQDDFIDCYSDEQVSGKLGTDIQEGKCTWLAVTALNRCNKSQKVVFTTCYGSQEPAHVERIKRLYEELQLREIYVNEERAIYETITKQINELPEELSPILFQKLLNMIYKRRQ